MKYGSMAAGFVLAASIVIGARAETSPQAAARSGYVERAIRDIEIAMRSEK